MTNIKIDTTDLDIKITKVSHRTPGAGGSWVQGKINNAYRFDALVFSEHAECEEYELGRTKISKLGSKTSRRRRPFSISIAAWNVPRRDHRGSGLGRLPRNGIVRPGLRGLSRNPDAIGSLLGSASG